MKIDIVNEHWVSNSKDAKLCDVFAEATQKLLNLNLSTKSEMFICFRVDMNFAKSKGVPVIHRQTRDSDVCTTLPMILEIKKRILVIEYTKNHPNKRTCRMNSEHFSSKTACHALPGQSPYSPFYTSDPQIESGHLQLLYFSDPAARSGLC